MNLKKTEQQIFLEILSTILINISFLGVLFSGKKTLSQKLIEKYIEIKIISLEEIFSIKKKIRRKNIR